MYAFQQDPDEKKIDLLLKEADNVKFINDSLGLSKVKQAEKLAVLLENDRKLGEVYTMLGVFYYVKGNYDLSLEMYFKSIPIHEKHKNNLFLARSLNGVGLIQSGFNQLEESIATFKKCLVIDKKNKNYSGVTRSYFNISLAQKELSRYEEATKSLKSALIYSEMSTEGKANNMIESKLGDLMLIANKPDSAFYYYDLVIKNNNPPANNWEKTYVYLGLAKIDFLNGNFDKAEKNALLAYEITTKNAADVDVARIAKFLSELYYKQKKYKQAYRFLEIANNLDATIFNDKKLSNINFLQLKNKEIENLKLTTNNERREQEAKRNSIIIYSFSALILLLTGAILLVRRNAKLKDAFNQKLHIQNQNIENQNKLITKQHKDLMSLNDSKNQLFSIISHDLRTPLNSIVQVLELQKDNTFPPELQDEIFGQLHIQAKSTSKMLNNLLEWANTQMDGTSVNFERIDLYAIVEHTTTFYDAELKKKQIELYHNTPNAPFFASADLGQVRIIIQNILANAIKFTPLKGKITINYSKSADFVNVHIVNTGIKISQERINQILNKSTRLTSEDGTAFEEGTGLGLLLVKQFLANNNGMLDLKSTEEYGTAFIISFLKN